MIGCDWLGVRECASGLPTLRNPEARQDHWAGGAARPNIAQIPTTNAMSVVDAMAQPWSACGSFQLMAAQRSGGTRNPPTAPIIGSKAFWGLASEPCSTSRLISNPTNFRAPDIG